MKYCTKCDQTRSVSEFNKNKRNKDGLQEQCNFCRKEYRIKNKDYLSLKAKFWRENNQDIIIKARKKYYESNKNKILDQVNIWAKENVPKVKKYKREYHLRKKYNISMKDQNEMLKKQGNKCAICNLDFKSGIKLCIDHCHTSGKVRGILCGLCNSGLGQFKESKNNLKSAIKYLDKWNK